MSRLYITKKIIALGYKMTLKQQQTGKHFNKIQHLAENPKHLAENPKALMRKKASFDNQKQRYLPGSEKHLKDKLFF